MSSAKEIMNVPNRLLYENKGLAHTDQQQLISRQESKLSELSEVGDSSKNGFLSQSAGPGFETSGTTESTEVTARRAKVNRINRDLTGSDIDIQHTALLVSAPVGSAKQKFRHHLFRTDSYAKTEITTIDTVTDCQEAAGPPAREVQQEYEYESHLSETYRQVKPSNKSSTGVESIPYEIQAPLLQPQGRNLRADSSDDGMHGAFLTSPAEASSSATKEHFLACIQWHVLLLGAFNICADTFIANAIIPVLPRLLGADEIQLSILLATGAFAAGAVGPAAGWFCDSHGWRVVLRLFYPLLFVSCVLTLFYSSNFPLFLIARFCAGVSSGVMYPSTLSMIVVTHGPKVRGSAMGFALVGEVGSLLGPIVGGLIFDYGGPVVLFRLLVAVAAVVTILYIMISPHILDSDEESVEKSEPASVQANASVCSRSLSTKPSTTLEPTVNPKHSGECSLEDNNRRQESLQRLRSTSCIPTRRRSQTRPPNPWLMRLMSGGAGLPVLPFFGTNVPARHYPLRKMQFSNATAANLRPTTYRSSKSNSILQQYLLGILTLTETDACISNCSISAVSEAIASQRLATSTSSTQRERHVKIEPERRHRNDFQMNGHNNHVTPAMMEDVLGESVAAMDHYRELTSGFPKEGTSKFYSKAATVRCAWQHLLETIAVFTQYRFLCRLFALYYCWGLSTSLLAILPAWWTQLFALSPTTIGYLFAPFAASRWIASVLAPYSLDLVGLDYSYGIVGGAGMLSLSVLYLWYSTSSPLWQALACGFIGFGLGLLDSSITAWVGLADFDDPFVSDRGCDSNYPDGTVGNSEVNPSSPRELSLQTAAQSIPIFDTLPEATGHKMAESSPASDSESIHTERSNASASASSDYQGRAFALTTLGCDLGSFTLPAAVSVISKHWGHNVALGLLWCGSVVVFFLCFQSR